MILLQPQVLHLHIFAPKLLTDKNNESEYQADGGIFANNPESVAANLAFELDDKLERKDMILISLGTGTIKMNTKPINLGKAGIIGWVIKANLIDVMMGTRSERYDAEIGYAYPNSCRLQLSLDKKNSVMDNTSHANLKTLIELTDDYINNNSDLIDYIIKMLLDNPKGINKLLNNSLNPTKVCIYHKYLLLKCELLL